MNSVLRDTNTYKKHMNMECGAMCMCMGMYMSIRRCIGAE